MFFSLACFNAGLWCKLHYMQSDVTWLCNQYKSGRNDLKFLSYSLRQPFIPQNRLTAVYNYPLDFSSQKPEGRFSVTSSAFGEKGLSGEEMAGFAGYAGAGIPSAI